MGFPVEALLLNDIPLSAVE